MKQIKLVIPVHLSMGATPYSQVTALYHYHLTEGSYTIQSYASSWGWSIVETKNFLDWFSSWREPCNNINYNTDNNNVVVVVDNNSNSKINNNKNQQQQHSNKTILINNISYQVEDSCTDYLYNSFLKNEECIELLSYWIERYIKFGGHIEIIASKELGTISACIRQGHHSKAIDVINWVFDSNHGRAKFLRENHYIFPSSIINKKTLVENYTKAKNDKTGFKALPTFNPSEIPSFDSDGNLITK